MFIASDAQWESRFAAAGLPLIGDDMKSLFGASILSQMLQELAFDRGHVVKCHVQQNVGRARARQIGRLSDGLTGPAAITYPRERATSHTTPMPPQSGGNTDFMNMLDASRVASKKISKERVISSIDDIVGTPVDERGFLFAGPSDYIQFYGDTKVANFHLELEGFGGGWVGGVRGDSTAKD